MPATAKPRSSANSICNDSGVIGGLNALQAACFAKARGERQPILNEW
jgi:hypothetical protein